MQTLGSLVRYNTWANARILPLLSQLGEPQLTAPVEAMAGSILETAQHLLMVEQVYLQMIGGEVATRPEPTAAAELVEAAARAGAGYAALLGTLDESSLEVQFRVPWFEREFTRRDGLIQAITHSTEHRADLAAALTRAGVTTPPIDYVVSVIEP
jgi:uncharacterized damage-inducible protein DinB